MLLTKSLRTSAAALALCIALGQWPGLGMSAALAADTLTGGAENFSAQYTTVTKKILLNAIELERFSLKYRKETARQPKFRSLRYVLAQEAGAGCGLGFEIEGDRQFGVGRRHPLRVNKQALKDATTTAMVGSIVASSSSAFELGSNFVHSIKNAQKGYDSKSANRFVSNKLDQIDSLLRERDQILASHSTDPAYERAMVEGKILRSMRSAFIDEYSQFHADVRTYSALQNSFFALNSVYNGVGAIAAGLANKGVTHPMLNGAANILFIVSGGMAAVTPAISSGAGWLTRRVALASAEKACHGKGAFDPALLATEHAELKNLIASEPTATLIPSLSATDRLAIYTDSTKLFGLQLANETRTMRRLNEVALQTSLLGPPIGGLLMTQGILGTHASFAYAVRPRKQLNLLWKGAICGTVGTSAAVVGNAAWLLASFSYQNHLRNKHQLPSQLIDDRLQHLDDLEKTVSAL